MARRFAARRQPLVSSPRRTGIGGSSLLRVEPDRVAVEGSARSAARAVHAQAEIRRGPATRLTVLTAVEWQFRRDPLGGLWSDGPRTWSTRNLAPMSTAVSVPILTPGCLSDGDALAALDDRGTQILPGLRPYLRT